MRRLLWGIGSVASAAGRVRLRPAWGRRVMVRASLASVVVASLAVTALPAPAGAKVSEPSGQPDDRALPAAAARGSGWLVTPSPNPVIPTGQLFWVSCPAADSCMAVGTYVKPSGAAVNLAERWNGHTWRIQPTPAPQTAATCSASRACRGRPAWRSGAMATRSTNYRPARWPNGGTGRGGASSPRRTPRRRMVPDRRVVHLAVGVHRGRRKHRTTRYATRGDPGRAVGWPEVADPGHPQPARERGQAPGRRGVHIAVVLHGGRQRIRPGHRHLAGDAGRAVERPHLADRAYLQARPRRA
jgi:hypothetical protein